MILELRDLLRRSGQLPLKELVAKLDLPPELVRAMLDRLIQKGQVERLPLGTLCGGGCRNCPPETVEIYRWVDHT
jgi:DNA-binding IclR family transcriptional regulator